MLIKWVKNASYPTTDAIAADLKYLLTGGTDKNQLNAATDKNATEFFTGVYTPTWTLHHNISSTQFVLKNAVSDDPTKFVYAKFAVTSVSTVDINLYETWNSTTSVGTYGTDTVRLNSAFSSGTYSVFISITPKSICIFTGLIGSTMSGGAHVVIAERSRLSPWDTPANGYNPYIIHGCDSTGSNAVIQGLRIKNDGGIDVAESPASYRNLRNFNLARNVIGESGQLNQMHFSVDTLYSPAGNMASFATATTLPVNANGKKTDVLMPLAVAGNYSGGYPNRSMSFLGGFYSQNADLWAATYGRVCAFGDELISNDATYILIPVGTNTVVYALRKG